MEMSFLCRYAHSTLSRYSPRSNSFGKTPRFCNAVLHTTLFSALNHSCVRERQKGRTVKCVGGGDWNSIRVLSGSRREDVVLESGLECTNTQSLQLADVLENVKANLLPTTSALKDTSAELEGTGRHLGLDIEWKLILGTDGAFVERFSGDKFSCCWGVSAESSRVCWETDYSGISRCVELDDFESCLLTTWLRSGQWLLPSVLRELHVELEDSSSRLPTAPDEAVMSSWTRPTMGQNALEENILTDSASMPDRRDDQTVDIAIRLKTGKVKVALRVDRSTWLPCEICQDLFGDRETWSLLNWQLWGNSKTLYPGKIVHTATSGGHHEYITTSGQSFLSLKHSSTTTGVCFTPPECKLVPPNYSFDHTVPTLIPAWKTPSCHVLVKPVIDGKEIGYMILDTGASGLVMEKLAADALELECFGELFVSGVSGKVPAHFRRAKSLVLGPLTLKNPQFMEMPVPGLVAGACSPVVGIIGYDVFRRAVVEIEPKPGTGSLSPSDPNVIVKLHDIEKNIELPHTDCVEWCHLHMITNLPHIKARFSTNGTTVYEGLFMIDTGAGGAFVMFMSRAVNEYGLQNDLQTNIKTFVKGVGGSQTERLPVKNGALSWFELGGKKLYNISCLFFNGSKMDISVYACGILCMNMLQDSRLIIDYARQRMAVFHTEDTENSTASGDPVTPIL